MTPLRLHRLAIKYYWRIYLCVGLGAAIATSLIVGALLLGDSLEHSLKREALSRLGGVQLALNSHQRTIRSDLSAQISSQAGLPVAATLRSEGAATTPRGADFVPSVQVMGIDKAIEGLGAPDSLMNIRAGDVVINQLLSQSLKANVGDEIILRVPEVNDMPGGSPMARPSSLPTALRLRVAAITPQHSLGDFRDNREAHPPHNAFVNLSWLQERLSQPGRANLLLAAASGEGDATTLQAANTALAANWETTDAALDFAEVPDSSNYILRSSRVFLGDAIKYAVEKIAPQAQGVLSWFAFGAQAGDSFSPYFFAAGLQDTSGQPLADDEADILAWLADDLAIKEGDSFTLSFPVFSKTAGVQESSRTFRVRNILPMTNAWVAPELMPSFPGLHDAVSCRDWKPGIDLDLNKLRDKDDAYWREHKGAPKVFISMKVAEEIWSNPFGVRTGFRLSNEDKERLSRELPRQISPDDLGMAFVDLRRRALAGSRPANDLGDLFLGFSFLLIAAALLLTGMIFGFGVRWRAAEFSTLRDLGFSWTQIRRQLMAEGLLSSAVGSAAGIAGGGIFTMIILESLASRWRKVVGSTALEFHADTESFVFGCLGAGVMVWVALHWMIRRLHANEQDRSKPISSAGARPWGYAIATGLFVVALLLVISGKQESVVHYFGAGLCAWAAGIALFREIILRGQSSQRAPARTLWGLATQYLARRPSQSVAAVTMVATGCFLVLAVAANRHDPLRNAENRDSGSGGFAFYAETAIPIYGNQNATHDWSRYGLSKQDLSGSQILAFRHKKGDDASCLNQGNARQPGFLGAPWKALAQMHAFGVVSALDEGQRSPWELLQPGSENLPIPVVGDEATLYWGLGLRTGDTFETTDELGVSRSLRVVATLSSGILQGRLILSEEAFTRLFPGVGGYQTFLIDAPKPIRRALRKRLSRSLKDHGLSILPAWKRLALFQSVENTYLSIFQALGFLGLALGCLGVGVLLLYNVIARRGDISILRALGYTRKTLFSLLFMEHATLVASGVLIGATAGTIAAIPALLSPGAPVPMESLALSLLFVLFSGFGSTYLAAIGVLRQESLRNAEALG